MSIIRKNLPTVLLALVLMPLATQAQPPDPSTVVSVDCDQRYLSQRDAARVLGTTNFSQTYAKRQTLYANLGRLCSSGVARVLLTAEKPQASTRALASR